MTTQAPPRHNPNRIIHNDVDRNQHSDFNGREPHVIRRKANAGRTPLGYRREQAALRRVEPLAAVTSHRPPLGRVLAEFGMLVGWFALWLLNGAATAFGVAALGELLSSRGLATGLGRTDWLIIGGVFHLFISAVEGHLWRSDYERPDGFWPRFRAFFANADRMRLGLAVFIGALDSLSTAWYIRRIIYALVDNPLWGWSVVAGVLASLIALSGEPMLRNFGGKLIRLFREAK